MKQRRWIALAICLMLITSLFSACGTGTQTPAASLTTTSAASSAASVSASAAESESAPPAVDTEPIELVFWQNAYVTTEEQKKPQEEWVLTKVIRQFEAENPGVTIEMTIPPDQQAAHQTFKAAAMAQSGPDVVNLWTGMPLFDLRDVVLPLDDYVPQEDLENIIGWETVRDNFASDGTLLAYPASGVEIGCFLFNRKLISQAGLDFDTAPPQTPDELLAAMETLKNAGIQPIVADEGAYNLLFVFNFAAWWSQLSGTERIASNSMGITKYVEDEGFLDSLAKASEFYAKGYVNTDYITSKSAKNKFLQGEAALFTTGNWDIVDSEAALGEGNVGIMGVPQFSSNAPFNVPVIGGTGQSLAVAGYTEHPEMAVKFISYLSSREATSQFLKTTPKISVRKDITPEDLGWQGKPVYEKALELGSQLAYWTDNSQVPEVMNEYYKVGALAIVGRLTPMEAAEALDRKAAELMK